MSAKRIAGRLIRRLSGDTLMVRSLDRALRPRLLHLSRSLAPGSRVLDIGAKNALYRSFFTHCSFQTLDIDARHGPDIVADIHELGSAVPQANYDLILCTEVLEHVHHPDVAVEAMRKSLKPGGVLVASTPFLVPYHPDPTDYWRMTIEGWRVLTDAFSDVDVVWHGNQFLSVWYLGGMGWGMPLRLLDRLVFACFCRLPSTSVSLGLICQARR